MLGGNGKPHRILSIDKKARKTWYENGEIRITKEEGWRREWQKYGQISHKEKNDENYNGAATWWG